VNTEFAAAQAARKFAAQQLQATHPHLVPAGENALIAAAKNIRAELKRAFPAVRFLVRTSRFSMGDSITVAWTDGPTSSQVDTIIGRYSAGSFDGSQDLYTYERNAWTDAFGDAKYVHGTRQYSAAAIESAIRTVFSRYPGNLEQIARPTADDFKNGRLWNVNVPQMRDALQTLINVELSRRTWAIAQR
jgi:hypothetical protein